MEPPEVGQPFVLRFQTAEASTMATSTVKIRPPAAAGTTRARASTGPR